MSKGPAGTMGKYKPRNRLNVTISKKDFCKVYDKCLIDQNLERNLCIYCKWRIELDVRLLLDIADRERNGK